jgi:formate hydrogenlyase subunit 3/multisubunit Na+/H+ antiporter MnhD subunit
MMFVFISSNIIFFFIAWEAMALISYFLVIFESDQKETRKAGLLYVVMTHIGTAFLLIGFLIAYSYTKSFDIFGSAAAIPGNVKNIVFIMFLIGFGTKAGVIPLHIWLPYAHPAAPSNVSALMSGIMIKTAIYGLIRFVLCYLGVENTWWGIAILVIGIISAVIGVAYAFLETNIKKLLAFSSIENIGIIFIGLGIGFIAFARHNAITGTLAMVACLFHMFNHALFKGSMFLSTGSIHYGTHTKNMEELGGLIKKMPVTALFVLCGALSIAAIVPFNGFIGEWLTYQSLFANIVPGQIVTNILAIISVAALAMAGALAAASVVKLFGISFLGHPRSTHASEAKEVPGVMNTGIGILITLCLLIGLFPMTILKLIDSVVSSLSGASVFENLQGGIMIATYPLKISGNSISALTFLIALAVLILLTLVLIRIIGGKYIERKYGTWDCGFEALNARMQYTATGFSKPIKIVFRFLFKPFRKVHVAGSIPYHPESIDYEISSEHIFEKYFYKPLYEKFTRFSKKFKFTIQTGSIHNYLLYIFIALILVIAYSIFA